MAGKEHPLQAGATIGREGCDIVLADPEVSRRHAAIRLVESRPAIEDLGSTNGTFVNDERITGTRELSEGDAVRFGNTVWRLQATADATRTNNVGQLDDDPTAVQVAAGPPKVTNVAQAPAPAAEVSTPPPPPAPPPPAPAHEAPGAAQIAASVADPNRRGDVPPPPSVTPSAVRRIVQPPPQGQAPASFNPGETTTVRGSAATRMEATIFCFAVVALTAVALILYFILYEP